MSADLWKEFGSPDQELLTNPWRQPLDISLQAEKSDFESPAALPLTRASEFHKRSVTDTIFAFRDPEDLNHRIKSSQSTHKPQHPEASSLGECEITDKFSAADKASILIQRQSEAKEAFPKSTDFSHSLVWADTQAPDGDDEWGVFVEGPTAESEDSTSVEGKGPPKFDSSHDFQTLLCSSPPSGQVHPSEEVKVASPAVISTSSNLEQLMKASLQGPPPSNIPPPSILLCLITSIFQSLSGDSKNYDLQAGLSSHTSSTADQQSISKFRRRLAIIRASARVIAGRKLRWSRDGHLSQSMKIGPAQGGRAGGMKLTVLDRTEARREDRDVEEAIQTWKQQLGSLRALSAVMRIRESGYGLAIPELAEKMPIRVVKISEGGIIAAKSCFLCGLKRDERIEKVDIHVEDSFGEWWIDHWGHVDCVIFWDEHKDHLQQR